jgi:hypothetical protein
MSKDEIAKAVVGIMERFVSVFIICGLVACSPISSIQVQADKSNAELRVLFIGNSLTYSNDLPAIVQAMAEAGKQKRLVYKSLSYPDVSLEDQWNRGEAQKEIAKGRWDIVILQQGPSGLEESRRLLIEYTRRFDKAIRTAGAKPALFMVWPSHQRFKDFDRVIESYKLVADDVKGLVFPAGAAWLEAWKQDATLTLYSEDRFHPSVMGSYLAALVIYEKLYGVSSVGLPASLKIQSRTLNKIELPQDKALLLQTAATEVNKKF